MYLPRAVPCIFRDPAKLEIHVDTAENVKKKRRSLGLQNASIFHLCIVAGSRQNLYGPLNQNKMIFLYHFIEYNKEGKEFVLFTYFERVLLSNTLGYSACQ